MAAKNFVRGQKVSWHGYIWEFERYLNDADCEVRNPCTFEVKQALISHVHPTQAALAPDEPYWIARS